MEEDGQFATKLQKNQVLKAPIVHFAVSRGPGWMGWANWDMSDGGRRPVPRLTTALFPCWNYPTSISKHAASE